MTFLTAAVVVAGGALAQPWVPDPLEPVSSGGLVVVDRALARLSVHARLLVIGAHPDDEDNALLTWVGRGLGGEAAYLSLSRGEGGQNLIGSELGVELGAIRTGELLAARRLEGSRQYFSRAYDFGYTRSLEETFERWPRAVLREDTIRIIRFHDGQTKVYLSDLEAIESGDLSTNYLLQGGDVIVIPSTRMARIGYAIQSFLFPFQKIFGFGSDVTRVTVTGGL